ncbi:unnamed protein product [Pylaiella littoralis]
MSATFRNNRSDGSTGEDAGIGGRVASRPSMLDIYFTAGSIIPADPGDGDDDGTKFRDLVWVSDDETVWRAVKKAPGKECGSPRKRTPKSAATSDSVWVNLPGQAGAVEVPKVQTHAYDPSHALDLDDASKLNQMHEAPLLDLLLRRFRKETIYTNVADVLISVNPYKSIPLLYEVPLQQMQDEPNDEFEESDGEREDIEEGRGRGGGIGGGHQDTRPKALRNKLAKPHVFSVADRAFRYMKSPKAEFIHGKSRGKNQSIIISGESGAGKTEASKHVMRYLITASQIAAGVFQDSAGGGSGGGESSAAKRIEAILLRSSTVLEAFGNAKTLRNDNSSRFGKYIKLLYDDDCNLVGASTDHFLLEKSRLAKVDSGERGYHIFYQLLAGLGKKRAEGLFLGPPEEFHMISQGDCVTVSDEVDDGQSTKHRTNRTNKQEFSRTDDAMSTLGFEEDLKAAVFRTLAALLHLGNVCFEETDSHGPGQAKARVSISTNSSSSDGEARMANAARLLGLDEDALTRKVTWRAIMAPGKSVHEIALTARESSDNLSGLSKHTYGKLFTWIVRFINRCHHQHVSDLDLNSGENKPETVSSGVGDEDDSRSSFIGILDIFGFEVMATNSFEQLCINFANEVLQRQFNHYIFVLEQQAYKEEGLDVASIPFRNNEAIIELISKKPLGLMIILEDQVLTGRKAHAMNKLDDRSILDLYHQEHHRRNPHPNYLKPRLQCDQFILKHFAGSVTYDVAGFLEKNNDSLQDDLRTLLLDSEDPFVRELAELDPAEENQQGTLQPGAASPPPSPLPPPSQGETNQQGTLQPGAASPPPPPCGLGGGNVLLSIPCAMPYRATPQSHVSRQLDSLVTQLGLTEPHYIKCIKPNSAKCPGGWSSPLVIEQLRYSGVLEVVRIRREAYPIRLAYAEVYSRFRFLARWQSGGAPHPDKCSKEQARDICGEICTSILEPEEFQIGKTKVFLKDGTIDKLRCALKAKAISAACSIQTHWRAHAIGVRKAKALAAAVSLQAAARGFIARRRQRNIHAAVSLQAVSRGFVERLRFSRALKEHKELRAREAARAAEEMRQKQSVAQVEMARAARGFIERKRRQRENSGATVIQAGWRGYNARKVLESSRAARRKLEARRATKLQAWARMLLAGQAHTRARRASTTLASAWRMRAAVASRKRAVGDIIAVQASKIGTKQLQQKIKARKLISAAQTDDQTQQQRDRVRTKKMTLSSYHQALVRGMIARRRYALGRLRIIRVQALLRGFAKRTAFRALVRSARRLQIAVRRWSRNRDLRESVEGVFAAARRGDVREVTRHVTRYPQLLFVRDRYGSSSIERRSNTQQGDADSPSPPSTSRFFSTLLHAACESGGMDVVVLLEPFPEDVEAKDLEGNTSVHVAASAVDYDLVKYLAKRGNMDVDKALQQEKERVEHAQHLNRKQLDKAMLKKSEKVDYAFEIHTPDLLDKRNREGRLHFACSGEGELQQWLVPLRVVVALYQFRNDKRREPLVFVDTARRAWLVSLRNNRGETPLHVLAGACLVNFADADRRPPCVAGLGTLSGRTPVVVSMQRLAAWLIESGADPDALDESGQTAMHVAMESNNFEVVLTVHRKGGDVHLMRRSDGRSVITQVMEQGRGMDVLEQVSSEGVTPSNPLLPPPKKLFGFTYISFFIEKTTFSSSKHNTVLELTSLTPRGKSGAHRRSFSIPKSPAGRQGGEGQRETCPSRSTPNSTMSRLGSKAGRVLGVAGGEGGGVTGAWGGGVTPGAGAGDTEATAFLSSATIDRVVEQLFFVRISVYNAKGKLSETQQVLHGVCIVCCLV